MGFESCVLLNHDCLNPNKLERYGERVYNAILNPECRPLRFQEGSVIYTDHRDSTRLLVTGGLIGDVLAVLPHQDPTKATQVTLLKIAAEHLGYRLVRQRKK